MFDRIRIWTRTLKRDAYAAYLAARNPDTPWYVKVLAAVVAAYAFSPIDLIPDFIPVLGYLDDLIRIFVWIHPIHIAQLPNALSRREVACSKREVSAFDLQSYALAWRRACS
jgi:uncharacterized membrane protein YkvA (DUF1232 family)